MRKIIFSTIGITLIIELVLFTNSATKFYSKDDGLAGIGEAYEIELTLGNLEKNMGFVGFIHNFKNYVLRRDEVYYEQALESYKETRRAIDTLESLLPDVNDNLINLSIVEKVLKEYREHLEKAKTDLAKLDYVDLDKLIRVDDKPAQAALNSLFAFAHDNQKQRFEELIEGKRQQGLRSLFHFCFLIFGSFALVIYQRNRNEKVLSNSQKFFKGIIDKSLSPILVFGENGLVKYFNKQAEVFSFENGLNIGDETSTETLYQFFEIPEQDLEHLRERDTFDYSKEFQKQVGDKKRSYELSIKKFNSGLSGGIRGVISIYDRTDAVNLYQVSEVHHRVKNNLSLLSSIMGIYRLQYHEEEALVEVIDSIDQKLSSIASLYDNEQYLRFGGNSSFERYLQHLTNVYNGFSPERYITLETNLEDGYSMPDSRTIALGTIYMEFLTNLIKHSKVVGDALVSFKITEDSMGTNIELKEHGGELIDIKEISDTKSLGNKLNKILALQEGYNLVYKWNDGLILNLVPFRDDEEVA